MCCYKSQNTTNGFSKKPHCFQITSYLIFIFIAFVQYWLLTPSQEQGVERISCLVISSVLFFSVIVSTIIAAATDPTDLIVKKYKMSLESGEWFDVSQYRLYCDQCVSFVSDTSKHCRRCNRCVQNFDHHCKWINNCIGQLNYKSFLWMIVSVMLFSLFELFQQIWCIIRFHKFSSQQSEELGISPIGIGILSYLALILTLLIFIPITNLVFLHIWLITKKMTTYEYIIQLREVKRIKQNQKALKLLSKNKQQEQAIKLEQEKLKKKIDNSQKQDQQSDQSSKPGYEDEEFEEQKSNVMNNGGETRKHRTSINNKKEMSIYLSTNNKPDKVDHEGEGGGNLETNRTKKQINEIQNNIAQIANEQQQQIEQQNLQQILEKQETDSIINRSFRKLTKIVSLKMVFPEKELVHVSQPQSRNQSVSSIQQNINQIYNQSDNIFTSKQAALKAPQNSEQKNQKKVAVQYPQHENSIMSLKQPISHEQQNKISKNKSIDNVKEIKQDKVFFSSMQNPIKKEHELNNRVFSPGKTRQVLETYESFENNQKLQKKIMVNEGSLNDIQNNQKEKQQYQSFEINILEEKNQGNSVPLNTQLFQNDNSMLNQLNQTLDDSNKTRDKILNYDQTEKDLENPNLQENLLKQDEKNFDEKHLSKSFNKNNDITQNNKQQVQQTLQFKIQSKLQFDDFEQS